MLDSLDRFLWKGGKPMRISLISFFLVAILVLIIGCTSTPLENKIWDIKAEGNACWYNALAIARARAECGLPTKIVLAFYPGGCGVNDVSEPGWHAYIRDENGELQHTTKGWVIAHPMLEFDWKPDMRDQSSGNDIVVGPIHIFIPNEHWSEFRIISGKEYIKIL